LVRDGSARCEAHKVAAWAPSAAAPKRLRGRAAVERRKRWLSLNPFCVDCLAETPRRLTAIGVEIDHVVPLHLGGADDESNFATRCTPHHEIKTKAEIADVNRRAYPRR